jgi:sulfonate transport system permease protein
MELVVIVLPALWPVLVNTLGGIDTISRHLQDVVKSLQLNKQTEILKFTYLEQLPPS